MSIQISSRLLTEIRNQGENAYPEEGAGLMLDYQQDGIRHVLSLLGLENSREENARHNRYLITSIQEGKAVDSKSWRLRDDRSGFIKEEVQIQA